MSDFQNKTQIDYDILRIVGIRFKNPSEYIIKEMDSYLGRFKEKLIREPDITIEFVEEIKTFDLIHVEHRSSAFDKNGFYIFVDKNDSLKVKIPFEQIGSKCNIVCESKVRSIPLLNHIINFTFISKGYLPVHGSAFSYKGKSNLVMGWTHSGKTETLLAFANHGATYIGDEWVVLTNDGKCIFGNPVPISISEWYLEQIPNLIPKINFQNKALFAGIHFVEKFYTFCTKLKIHKSFPFKFVGQMLPSIQKQQRIFVNPQNIFHENLISSPLPLDNLFFTMSWENNEISISNYKPELIAESMLNSNEVEQNYFWDHYKSFRFAFPEVRNNFLDSIQERQRKLINKFFSNKKSYKVIHPYPVSFEKLFEKMEAIVNN